MRGENAGLAWIGAAVLVVAGLLVFNLLRISPDAFALLGSRQAETDASLLLHYAFLPRLAISLLAGAALGLSGVLFQQILQNPLAAPDTLAVTSGAQLALVIGLLTFPLFQAEHPEILAILGGFAAWGLIALIGWRRGAGPMTLILSGFVVSFALGAVASLLMMLNQEYMTSLLIWGAGSLVQTDWSGVWTLALRVLPAAIVVAILARPLLIIGFGDAAAGGLGISLRFVKPVLLGLAVFLATSTVAVVGIIGFVGLAAPHLARVMGAQRLAGRLIGAPVAGAALLTIVDQFVQAVSDPRGEGLPTGAITALIGAPLLILLLRRLPTLALEGVAGTSPVPPPLHRNAFKVMLWLAALAITALAAAFLIGRGPSGFTFGLALDAGALDWRIPRVVGAAGAGLALGVAGCLVQRIFGNPMASPEILGIGAGVAVGLIAVLMLSVDAGAPLQFTGAVTGAMAVTLLIASFGRERGFAPERLLLIGIAITALLNALTLLFLALGDPRIGQVLAWLGGSTYRVTPGLATLVTVIALAALLTAAPLGRWLEILPFGNEVARSMGLPVNLVRFSVLALAAAATAAAALVVGPMSFVGLLAPHLATRAGLRLATPQLIGAALIGCALVTFADWIGRVVFARTELPAGLLAVLIGSVLAMAQMVRRRPVST